MNTLVYKFVAFVLQASKAHNVTVDGGAKYSVPSEEVAIDDPAFEAILNGDPSSRNLTSHALAAISGADNFNDDETTITDVFDLIVNNTREVTPTCKFTLFTHIYSSSYLLTCPESSRNCLDSWVRAKRKFSLWVYSDGGLPSYISYKWPVRSVERLPPFSPKELKNPVLVMGSTVRAFHPRT